MATNFPIKRAAECIKVEATSGWPRWISVARCDKQIEGMTVLEAEALLWALSQVLRDIERIDGHDR